MRQSLFHLYVIKSVCGEKINITKYRTKTKPESIKITELNIMKSLKKYKDNKKPEKHHKKFRKIEVYNVNIDDTQRF